MAWLSDWNLVIIFLKDSLKLAQKISIGFRSGEYGGKNLSVQPAFFISSFVFADLWNVALSIITVCPGDSNGHNIFQPIYWKAMYYKFLYNKKEL